MRMPRAKGMGARANRAVGDFAAQIDAETSDAARQAAPAIVLAVRLLRWPTLVLLVVPVPFILGLLAIAAFDGSSVRWLALGVGIALALGSVAFGLRRHRILAATREPDELATELAIAAQLSGRVGETRTVLREITGGGGPRVFSRLRGMWHAADLGPHWIEQIADLGRARWFFPPSVGVTVTLTVWALWLVPVSACAFLILGIAALAH